MVGDRQFLWNGGWHGGSGLRAYNGLYPEQKVTIIILGNLDYANPVPIANELERILFSKT